VTSLSPLLVCVTLVADHDGGVGEQCRRESRQAPGHWQAMAA